MSAPSLRSCECGEPCSGEKRESNRSERQLRLPSLRQVRIRKIERRAADAAGQKSRYMRADVGAFAADAEKRQQHDCSRDRPPASKPTPEDRLTTPG